MNSLNYSVIFFISLALSNNLALSSTVQFPFHTHINFLCKKQYGKQTITGIVFLKSKAKKVKIHLNVKLNIKNLGEMMHSYFYFRQC